MKIDWRKFDRAFVKRATAWLALSALIAGLVGVTTGKWTLASPTSAHMGGVLQQSPDDDDDGTRWTGSVQSYVSRSTTMLSVSYTSNGDFWFTVDEDGNVEGYAVVVYEPVFDPAGMNAILDSIKALGAEMFRTFIPLPLGPLGPTLLDGALAVRAEWESPMWTREGPIQGTLQNGELNIEWDPESPSLNEQPTEIPLTVYFDKIGNISEVITETTFTVYDPWDSATVTEHAGRMQAVGTDSTSSDIGDGITESSGYTLSAHQT